MVALYEALFLVLKHFFSKLNRFTFRDFSDVNAANALSALVSTSLYFATRSFFADTRTCGLCNSDGRSTYAVFLMIGCALFNMFYFCFGHREQIRREKFKRVRALVFPVTILLVVWGSVVFYKIGVSLR